MTPKKGPPEKLQCRIGFATSFDQDDRMKDAAARMKISVAEWLRRAVKNQLTRQRL